MHRYRSRNRKLAISAINITPMVDVMLVMLIIFMVTTPMLLEGIKVDLPKVNAQAISGDSKPLVVSINKKGEVFLFETKIEYNQLIKKLLAVTKTNKDTRIFVKADKNALYGTIAKIMSYITNAGFTQVSLVTDIQYNEEPS